MTALDEVLGALASEPRRDILARLAEGEQSVGEITALLKVSQPTVSNHLKVLERAGLVSRRRVGTTRFVRLEPDPLAAAEAWLAAQRQEWTRRLERMEVEAKRIVEERKAR